MPRSWWSSGRVSVSVRDAWRRSFVRYEAPGATDTHRGPDCSTSIGAMQPRRGSPNVKKPAMLSASGSESGFGAVFPGVDLVENKNDRGRPPSERFADEQPQRCWGDPNPVCSPIDRSQTGVFSGTGVIRTQGDLPLLRPDRRRSVGGRGRRHRSVSQEVRQGCFAYLLGRRTPSEVDRGISVPESVRCREGGQLEPAVRIRRKHVGGNPRLLYRVITVKPKHLSAA